MDLVGHDFLTLLDFTPAEIGGLLEHHSQFMSTMEITDESDELQTRRFADRIAARAGYDYVSLRPIYMGLPGEPNYELAENPQMLKQTKRALAATGVVDSFPPGIEHLRREGEPE